MTYKSVIHLFITALFATSLCACGTTSSVNITERLPDNIPDQSTSQSVLSYSQSSMQPTNVVVSGSSKDLNRLESLFGCHFTKEDDLMLLSEITSWLGVKYKYAGSDKNGTDCSGLVMNIYKCIYQKHLERSSKGQFETNCRRLKLSQIRQGDLVFFKIDKNEINHVGLYVKNNKFVHASTQKGVIISDLEEDYYKKYFYCAGRVK